MRLGVWSAIRLESIPEIHLWPEGRILAQDETVILELSSLEKRSDIATS